MKEDCSLQQLIAVGYNGDINFELVEVAVPTSLQLVMRQPTMSMMQVMRMRMRVMMMMKIMMIMIMMMVMMTILMERRFWPD